MKRLFFILFFLWPILLVAFSQNISITGESPNSYLKVDEVFLNSVRITETLDGQFENFVQECKVMIIQMTGVTIDTSSSTFKTTSSRTKDDIYNTGRFEVLQVDEIVTGVDTIIYFTDNFSNTYDNGQKIQLVKLIEGETVTISGALTTKPWDGNIGGIVGIIGIDSVKFANGSIINANARGFRGGLAPVENYTGSCRYGLSSLIKDTLYFKPWMLNRSGNKGEGIIVAGWPYTKGTAFNINGGGAGNGLFSGGGGGGNFGNGGDGGQQSSACLALYSAKGGWGGYGCAEFYTDPLQPKIVMGGGGGSGNRLTGFTPSRGGNGGGIVLIITGTIYSGTGVSIQANGENAASSAGSGGGGGAGGSILIDASTYKGSPIGIYIRGGSGGNSTTPAPNSYGGGGSGSGGIFWHSGSIFPYSVIDSLSSNPGSTGGGPGYFDQIGVRGGDGSKLENLVVPLTGFLFNSIRGTDTICENQYPDTLTASQPKGGNGIYSYAWQQSLNKINWSAASGIPTLRSFVPVALSQTTYYRRIVNSVSPVDAEPISDTSRTIEVFVYPAITNNSILGTDTICYHLNALPLTGISTPLGGGDNSYQFIWQQSTEPETWTNIGNEASFDPAELDITTNYRRIVRSTAYCSDTANVLTVTVLPSIQNNVFNSSELSVCENGSPGRLGINMPAGGDGNYTYQWQYRQFPGSWINITSTTDSVRYTVGNLSDTTAFRRIVYSGNDNACIHASDSILIIIRSLISNNYIEGSPVKYTCYNSSITIPGSDPAEGFGPGTYNFAWEESTDNSIWNLVTATGNDYESEPLNATRFYRRIVYSSLCTDVSPAVEVRINPLPTGNVYNAYDTLCAGDTLYVKFNVSGNGPFDVTAGAEGETERTVYGIAGPVDSVYFFPQITKEFILHSIIDDSSCIADVSGFSAVTPGIVYEVPLANAGDDFQICDNSAVLQAVKTKSAYHGLWTGTAVFTNDTLENSEVAIETFGSYIFTWTESNWQCVDNDEVEITFFEQPQVPEAGSDQALEFVYTTQLNGSIPSVGNGLWTIRSGNGTISNTASPDAEITGLSENATLQWTITNGNCPAVADSMKILVNPLKITKGFTPNDDNRNDYFDLGAEHAERIKLRVFNSAGVLVFESDNYNSDESERWYGKNMNGIELPEGTYFYIATIKVAGKEEEVLFKSFVEILRD